MRPLEVTTSGILATIGVFAIAAVCIRLGFWQLDRRDQRAERNAAVAERLAAAPVALRGVPRDTAGLTHRRATITGEWDGGRSAVLAGRSHLGAPGVYVFAPVRLPDGAVLVNRGWLAAADAATVDPEQLAIAGTAEVEGVLMPFPDVDAPPPPEGFRRTWFRLDGEALRAQYPYDVAQLYLLRTGEPGRPAAAPAGGRGPLALSPPELDGGPHLSYALQWFGFAAVALIGWIALVIGRHRREDLSPPGPRTSM